LTINGWTAPACTASAERSNPRPRMPVGERCR
jgi:hypothetical protein